MSTGIFKNDLLSNKEISFLYSSKNWCDLEHNLILIKIQSKVLFLLKIEMKDGQ